MPGVEFVKKIIVFILFLGFIPGLLSASEFTLFEHREFMLKNAPRVNHRLWDKWLNKYVDRYGNVNYQAGLRDKEIIEKYLKQMLSLNPYGISGREQKLVYFINLYNALVVWGVLDNYPVKSVVADFKDGSFFRAGFYLNNRKINLDILEKEMIMDVFKEPLAHFALSHAAKSSPPLKNRAYEAANLKRNLLIQAKSYMQRPEYIRIDKQNKKIYMIEMFQRYKKDFGDLFYFYNKVMATRHEFTDYEIVFTEYDWSLNSQ